MEIIIGRHGNQKTPIKDPTVSRKHCKVTIDANGTITVENLSQSGTKIDGLDIIRSRAELNSRIQLGQSFSARLVDLIGNPMQRVSAEDNPRSAQPMPETGVKTFNISHLERVWEDFNQANIAMADKQRRINITRTGLGILTMCAMPTIYFCGPAVGCALTGIGVLGNIYSFAGMKNAETAEQRQQRQDAFDDAWICPNPDCGRTLPARNYKMLVRNHQSCPYCKCKYVEK